jgi:hypothetical protein
LTSDSPFALASGLREAAGWFDAIWGNELIKSNEVLIQTQI